jgi:hypothetical protein
MNNKKIIILGGYTCGIKEILHNLKGDEVNTKTPPVLDIPILNIPTPNRKERRKLKRSNKLGK